MPRSEVVAGKPAAWHDDPSGLYFRRYADHEGRWTGAVRECLWDLDMKPTVDDRFVVLLTESLVLSLHGNRLVVGGGAGSLHLPLESITHCAVTQVEDEGDERLTLDIVAGLAEESRLTQWGGTLGVSLKAHADFLDDLQLICQRVASSKRSAARWHRRLRAKIVGPSRPEPQGPWYDDPYKRFARRLRDRRGRWTGWVLQDCRDPWLSAEDCTLQFRDSDFALQRYGEHFVVTGRSGTTMNALSSGCMASEALAREDQRFAGDSQVLLHVVFALEVGSEPTLVDIELATSSPARDIEKVAREIYGTSGSAEAADRIVRPPERRPAVAAKSEDPKLGDRTPAFRRGSSTTDVLAQSLNALVDKGARPVESEFMVSGSTTADVSAAALDTTGRPDGVDNRSISGLPMLPDIVMECAADSEGWLTFAPLPSSREIRVIRRAPDD